MLIELMQSNVIMRAVLSAVLSVSLSLSLSLSISLSFVCFPFLYFHLGSVRSLLSSTLDRSIDREQIECPSLRGGGEGDK
jgi:hypothetical protein